ncbi:MAG: hypothetical protein GX989_07275 [Firmicutes bacterium]|nr:hypothetical protein [Bacillota bacterium]
MFFVRNKTKNAGKFILGLGALITGMGRLVGGRTGDGLTGFGLAHVVMGTLDLLRPGLRGR